MKKMRVYELARELGTTSKKLIEVLKDMNIPIKNHMSSLDEDTAKKLISVLTGQQKDQEEESIKKGEENMPSTEEKDTVETAKTSSGVEVQDKDSDTRTLGRKARKASMEKARKETKEEKKKIVLEGNVSVNELASKLEDSSTNVLSILMDLGIHSHINQDLSPDVIELVASEYDVEVSYERDMEEEKLGDAESEEESEEEKTPRYPVVAVLGHVDHGKTSLLDYIRKSNVTDSEAGGITQHIGAYRVLINDNGIIFLDTPGHEAFTSMRARGAQATDIAIIVVAANDGIMPQTVEAINHVKAAGVNIIVAINKIDKKNANIERVKQQLADQGLIPEEWGGDTICVPVCALSGEGIDELLEMIVLVAEMNEYKTNLHKTAKGIVIESNLDKGKGPLATVLIQNGTLKIGDPVVCGHTHGRIRAMVDDRGENIKEADACTPVKIVGLNNVPQAGDQMYKVNDEKFARHLAEKRAQKHKEKSRQASPVSFDDLFEQITKGEVKELNLIIKGDVHGSVEALQDSLMKLSIEEVKIKIIHSGVGAVTESDVMLAAASNAAIIGFNVRPDAKARKMAETENVDIRSYRVIYEVIEDVKAAVTGMLDPEYKEVVQGVAEVRQIFKSSRVGNIAGSYISEGKISRNSSIRVIRDGQTLKEGKIASLKRFKEDVKEVSSGYECGILIDNFNDFKEGDILEAYTMEEVKII